VDFHELNARQVGTLGGLTYKLGINTWTQPIDFVMGKQTGIDEHCIIEAAAAAGHAAIRHFVYVDGLGNRN
jgi:hypothetical protein